ncbi:MAG: hypothetical protein AB1439_12775 [candidate division FCPU426 bacterium]
MTRPVSRSVRFRLIAGVVLLAATRGSLGAEVPPQQLAEQMYNCLKDRYAIRNYQFDQSPGGWQVTFTLANGQTLTYDDSGRLLKKLLPDGSLIQYAQGYPVRHYSASGELVDRTEYLFTSQGRIKRALRFFGKQVTASYYDDEGNVLFEIQQGPDGLCYRCDFSWGENRRTYSYLETRSRDGLTDYFKVNTTSGLPLEHWRVSGGMTTVWDERYALISRLLQEKVRQEYSDRRRLKTDSYGQTRGDVILKYLRPEVFYPLRRFIADSEERRVVFDEEWKFIDCTDIEMSLPWVDMVEEENVLVQKVKIEGDRVMMWVPERRRWERYPFDPEEEELVPLNMRGDATVKSRYARTFWRADPEKMDRFDFSARLLIPDEALENEKLRLSQHQNDEPDFDDLHRLLQAAAESTLTPLPTPLREGESVLRLEPEQARLLQLAITYQVKRDLLLSPQMAQRDSDQHPQFDLLLRSLSPERMLSLSSLAGQLGRLRRLRNREVEQWLYSDIEVFLPEVDKEKTYTWISRVERGGRGLRIWQSDSDHPEKGYWMPYALRPGRDELMEKDGAWQLRVDEGRFHWKLQSLDKSRRVSGSILGMQNWDQKNDLRPEQAVSPATVVPAGATAGARAVSTVWRTVLGRMLAGGKAEKEIKNWPGPGGYRGTLYQQTWLGRPMGYRRVWRLHEAVVQTETYGPDGRLQSWNTARGEAGKVVDVSPERTKLEIQYRGRSQTWHLSQGRVEAMTLPDGKRLLFNRTQNQTQVRYLDEKGQLQLIKEYDQVGRRTGLQFPSGETATYKYPNGNKGVELVFAQARAQCVLRLDAAGSITSSTGNMLLINRLKKNISLLMPDRLEFPEVSIKLKLD